jgi:hypothetical protein
MVIVALVVLAVVIAVATVVFWRVTRPEPVREGAGLRWSSPEGQRVDPPAANGLAPSVDLPGGTQVDRQGPAASGGPPTPG